MKSVGYWGRITLPYWGSEAEMIDAVLARFTRWALTKLLRGAEQSLESPFDHDISRRLDRLRVALEMMESER
jgi:hypothetical protein